jgi:hypothetical protein
VIYVIAFLAVFVYLWVLWVVVLVVYNLIFEPFDFGALSSFAWKSCLLIGIMSVIYLIPYVHWGALLFWWFGLMLIFNKDFWECRILVFLIWGIGFISRLLIIPLILSS